MFSKNLHGKDLQNTEYVKYDLSGQDLGEANLQGAYMSVTTAKNASFKGANMKDLVLMQLVLICRSFRCQSYKW